MCSDEIWEIVGSKINFSHILPSKGVKGGLLWDPIWGVLLGGPKGGPKEGPKEGPKGGPGSHGGVIPFARLRKWMGGVAWGVRDSRARRPPARPPPSAPRTPAKEEAAGVWGGGGGVVRGARGGSFRGVWWGGVRMKDEG